MTSIDEKISIALRIINGNINIYDDRFKRIYPFTTENINGYLPEFKLKGTKLLTVGSSTDQAINASMAGCQDITVLDICPFSKEYFYLKNAAIQTLTKKEYERFLLYNAYHLGIFENGKVLNKESFTKIAESLKELDEESHIFWSTLLDSKKSSTIRNRLFSHDEYGSHTIRRINPYLSDEESYLKARESLQTTKVNFIEGNIMSEQLPETYDNIFLSNIPCYQTLEETKTLVERLLPHLNEDGQILVSYLYELYPGLDYCDGESEIYNSVKAKRLLPRPITLKKFDSVNGGLFTDGALIYQKKK